MPLSVTKHHPVHFILNPGHVQYELDVLMVWKLSRPEWDSNPWYPAWKLSALTTRPPSPFEEVYIGKLIKYPSDPNIIIIVISNMYIFCVCTLIFKRNYQFSDPSVKILLIWINLILQIRVWYPVNIYRILSNYSTYPYKHTVKQFLSLQFTAHVLLSTSFWKYMLLILIWIASNCWCNSNEYQQHMLLEINQKNTA